MIIRKEEECDTCLKVKKWSLYLLSEIQHSQLFLLLMLLITRTNVVTNLSWFLVY